MKQKTYGEAWLQKRLKALDEIEKKERKADLSDIDFTRGLPKKMNKEKAAKYYNDKLLRYWRKAGYLDKGRRRVALKWIEYWITVTYKKAYEEGRQDALKEIEEV